MRLWGSQKFAVVVDLRRRGSVVGGHAARSNSLISPPGTFGGRILAVARLVIATAEMPSQSGGADSERGAVDAG